MNSRREGPAESSLTHLLVVAIVPALIIVMVACLVFFLTHLFYDGEFGGRVRISCGLFVMATVLISRISIDEGREYASLFAIPLSFVGLLSIVRYTDAGFLLTVPLLAGIWWATDKLTWDCTVLHEDQDASGQGLLQTVGLEGRHVLPDKEREDIEATTDTTATHELSLWQRWKQHRHRHHTPGVWVVYFGLAAIPLFGFGQLVLAENERGPAFLLLVTYVASALALLMSTSFLQLRRYLLQRHLPLPDETGPQWLATGGIMIVILLLVCLALPRPNTGYSIVESFDRIGSPEIHQSQRLAPDAPEGVVDPKNESPQGDIDQDASKPSNKSKQSQEPTSTDSETDSKNSGSADARSAKSRSSTSDSSTSDSSQSQSEQWDSEPSQSEPSPSSKSDDSQTRSSESKTSKAGPADSETSESRSSASRSEPRRPTNPFRLPNLPRLIYWLGLAVVVGFVLVKYGREIRDGLGSFVQSLLRFWRDLWGTKTDENEADHAVDTEVDASGYPAFAQFRNPFAAGGVLPPLPQLTSYTFAAFQAWAAEHNCVRQAEQTPLEFADDVAVLGTSAATAAKNLAVLYNQVAYAQGTSTQGSLGADALVHLRQIWNVMCNS